MILRTGKLKRRQLNRLMTVLMVACLSSIHGTVSAQLPVLPPFDAEPSPPGRWKADGPAAPEPSAPQPEVINPFAERLTWNPAIPEPQLQTPFAESAEHLLKWLEKPATPLAGLTESLLSIRHMETQTRLSIHCRPLDTTLQRPDLLFEAGESFLKHGWLSQGIETPTGAVWRPAFWVFGTYRTGISYFDSGRDTTTEWANRLDLFGQLNLSGTERLLVGVRPLDEQRGQRRHFTGYDLKNGRTQDAWNFRVQTLFFEGDIGELFPNIDPLDVLSQDYGFSVGRQPLLVQQGLLLNEDMMDAFTLTRNTLNAGSILNLRATMVYAWNEINRSNNQPDDVAHLFGLLTETDTESTTWNADIVWVRSGTGAGSLLTTGLSAIRRLQGRYNIYNSSLHVLVSVPTDQETQAAGQGELLFSQFSWTPHQTQDIVYLNTFWAIDRFTSAARGPLAGGPLGQTGILFSAAGLGNYRAPMNDQTTDAFGASLGYQLFFCGTRRQLTFELAGRQDTSGANDAAVAGGIRYQQALDQHWLLIVDAFTGKRESADLSGGARVELQMKF